MPRIGRRDRMPTAAETEAILVHASPQFRLIYSARRPCGARPGEPRRTTIADVYRTANTIILQEHKTARNTGHLRRIHIRQKAGRITRSGHRKQEKRSNVPDLDGSGIKGRQFQPDVHEAQGERRSPARLGAVPGPPRMRHKDLPREGNRIRPPPAGALGHLDHGEIHTSGRQRFGRMRRI